MEVTNEVYQLELNKYIDQLQTAEMEVKEAEVIFAIIVFEVLCFKLRIRLLGLSYV